MSQRSSLPNSGAALGGRSLFFLLSLLLLIPGVAIADWQTGLDALKAGDLKAAESNFRQVVDDKPDWFGGYRMLGQVLLRQDKLSAAVTPLKEAHRLNPDDVGTRFDLGRALLETKRAEEAFKALEGDQPAGMPDKSWAQWLQYRVSAARQASRFKDASADLKILTGLKPKDAKLYYLWSTVSRELGQTEAERRHLAKASQLAPNNPTYLAKGLVMDFAAASKAAGESKSSRCAALSADGRRLAGMKADASYLRLAGRIASCAGHSKEAVELLAKAVDAGSGEWDTAFHLGRHQLLLGDFETGSQTLSDLLPKSDSDQGKKIHQELGYAYQLQNRFDEAIRHYDAAGSAERVAQAKEAKSIYESNQAEDVRYRKEMELRKELEQAEADLKAAQNGL